MLLQQRVLAVERDRMKVQIKVRMVRGARSRAPASARSVAVGLPGGRLSSPKLARVSRRDELANDGNLLASTFRPFQELFPLDPGAPQAFQKPLGNRNIGENGAS